MTDTNSTNFYKNPGLDYLKTALYHMPTAYAEITGNPGNGEITGIVRFYPANDGVLINAEIYGLPIADDRCGFDIFGFHIHEGNSCTGNNSDPYANARSHYNPTNCPHPAHKGDLPPLFGNHGSACMMYVSDHFQIPDLIGKTVIIHSKPDDFTTQPSGNSGDKIACGTIRAV